jgi:hypothetical protein
MVDGPIQSFPNRKFRSSTIGLVSQGATNYLWFLLKQWTESKPNKGGIVRLSIWEKYCIVNEDDTTVFVFLEAVTSTVYSKFFNNPVLLKNLTTLFFIIFTGTPSIRICVYCVQYICYK